MADQADTIFDDKTSTTEKPKTDEQVNGDQTTNEPSVDNKASQPSLAIPEELQELVGEGKKYSSLEDALKAIPHAQKHISTLEQENKQYKESLEKAKAMEELLEQMKTQQPKEDKTNQQVGVDADDLLSKLSGQLDSLVEQKLTLKQQQQVQQTNKQAVANAFKEAYGEKAEEIYNSLAEEAGVDIATLNNLAANSPKALFKMAGIGSSQPKQSSTKSSVSTEAFLANAGNKPKEIKQVMFGASSSDVLEAWRASKPQS